MKHPYETLRPEIEDLLATMLITNQDEVDRQVKQLILPQEALVRYLEIQQITGVPAALAAALHYRESTCDFKTNMCNGDPLTRPTMHVPAGRPKLGPPPNDKFPVSFVYAAVDAFQYDHLDDITAPWTLPYAIYKAESYNGYGPRNHGIFTGYNWSFTNHYRSGKYTEDGPDGWDRNSVDKQIGTVPIMIRAMALAPKLRFDFPPTITANARTIHPPVMPTNAPTMTNTTMWLQKSLNQLAQMGRLQADTIPLDVDGSLGRRTREAVRAFQKSYNLRVDGIPGRQTNNSLEEALLGGGPKVVPLSSGQLAEMIVRALRNRGDQLYTDGTPNNVYVEGMDQDGRDNGNRPNQFNDSHFLIVFNQGTSIPVIVYSAEATDEPGKYWTDHPMNAGGAARIAFGQHDSWCPGSYHGVPAWTQDQPVAFYRDAIKNYKRAGAVHNDIIGLHQHQGYDLPFDNLGKSSAGCLVRRMRSDHLTFMRLTTAGGRKRLRTSIIDCATVLSEKAP